MLHDFLLVTQLVNDGVLIDQLYHECVLLVYSLKVFLRLSPLNSLK